VYTYVIMVRYNSSMPSQTNTVLRYDGQTPEEFQQLLQNSGILVQVQPETTMLLPNGIYVSPETNNTYYMHSSGQGDGFRYEQYVTSYYQDLALTARAFMLVFAIELPRPTVPVYITSRTRFTFNAIVGYHSPPALKGIQKNTLEGDFSEFFAVYSRDKHALDAYTTVVPNLMVDLLTKASEYDIEFAGNYVYFYQPYNPASVVMGGTEKVLMKLSTQDYIDMRDFGLKYGSKFVRAARPSTGDIPADTKPLWQLVNENQAANNTAQLKWLFGIIAYMIAFLLLWRIVIPLTVAWMLYRYIQWSVRKKRLISRWVGRV
jgi:hypothetical protein